MKLQKLKRLCIKRANITVLETSEYMWIGDGCAVFPIYDMPKLTDDQIYTLFDVSREKRGAIKIRRTSLPYGYNFDDADCAEKMLKPSRIDIGYNGYSLLPYYTANSEQMVYINSDYLKPVEDSPFSLWLRVSSTGQEYVAVKRGLIIIGVIMPMTPTSEDYHSELAKISRLDALIPQQVTHEDDSII